MTSVKEKLKEDIERLEEAVTALCEANGTPYESRKEKQNRESNKPRKGSAFDPLDNPGSSSGAPVSKEEIMRRYIDELSADLEEDQADVAAVTTKMDKIGEMYSEFMVEEMRYLLKETSGTEVETRDNVTRESVIASMEAALAVEFPLADWLKKPAQPKGVSRAAWLEHLKMAKKFADCFAHMLTVERTGDALDVAMAHVAVNGVDDWEDKYKRGGDPLARIEHVSKLVAYEVWRRLEAHEYFFCTFCTSVEFSVAQHLAHFASGVHCKYARKAIDDDGANTQLFAFAAKHLLNLSSISDELHVFYSTQYSSPYVESGARVPNPDKRTIPTENFLSKIEQKYAKKINGDVDMTRISEPAYLSSVLPEIVARHKSDVGRELFRVINDYLGKGKKLFCPRCRVMVSNRTLYYRHLVNPYHLNADYLEDGRQLNLLTMSVNIHTREVML